VLSAEGGTGGSPNAVQYVAQELTDEQKAQARENIGAKAATEKSAYIISRTRSYGHISMYGMDFDGIYAQIQSGKVVMLLVDDCTTYYGVIHPASGSGVGKEIVFYNIADISDSGGRDKGIEYFGFTWREGDNSLTEWWGNIPRVEVDSTLTNSGSAADAKAVGDELAKKQPKGDYLTTETDPTVPAWAKSPTKPTYTAAEVGALPNTTVIPPAYTLPQATSTALGGIKADAATDEDTQDVRIGADGKMKTKPTGGSTITVDSALSSTSENPVQNKIVTSALAEKITAPSTASVGQIIKVKSVDNAGKPTEWEATDMPSGGGGKEWTKILEAEVTEATAIFEISDLDNYTELLVINGGLQNATSTDSAQNLYINGIQVCLEFVNVPKSGSLAYNHAIAKYNGLVWECRKPGRAISQTNITPSNAYIPYNVVLGVGKATTVKLETANSTYAPITGKITIYGR